MFKYSTISGPVAVAGLAFMLALGGCSSGSDAPPEPEVTTPEPTPDPEPTDLEKTQMAAKAAADAAKMASDGAAAAASGANAATMKHATRQTGEMARMYAMDADKYAKMAMAAYMDAKKASEAAAAATLASAAGAAKADAEAAQMAAEKAAEMAGEKAMKATDAAKMELMIDGTMKSVGDTTVDAMAGASSVTTGTGKDARTVVTGLIKDKNPMATGMAITGNDFTQAVSDDLSTEGDETAKAVPYKQAAAERMFAIGKTLDSSDDMARLMIVTDYAGLKMVKVFSEGDDAGTAVTGTKAGYLTIDDANTATTDTNNTALRSEGMFYPVSGGTAGTLAHTDSIAADSKPMEVFSYVPPTGATDAGVRQYATLKSTTTEGATTTYAYTTGADIMHPVLQDGPDAGTNPEEGQVTSGIPAAVAYKHLHFGVWASLGEAAQDGMQKIADLGIGFVQSTGDGMTGADMPNAGSGTYNGNWVATVQSTDATGGTMSLDHGAAELTADFGKSTITADLKDLAKLEGTISGSEFSGMKASSIMHGSLASGGSYEGSFSGGFYGSKAAEAGGIFDFSSDGSGAFRGAFGGKQMP